MTTPIRRPATDPEIEALEANIAELKDTLESLRPEVEGLSRVLAYNTHIKRSRPDPDTTELELVKKSCGNWMLHHHQAKHVSIPETFPRSVEDEDESVEFVTEWMLPDIEDIMVVMKYTLDGSNKIRNLKISMSQKQTNDRAPIFDDRECLTLMKFCQENCMTSFFFLHLEELFIHFRNRRAILDSRSFQNCVVGDSTASPFHFVLGSKDVDLVKLSWKIEFEPKSITVSNQVRVEFSQEGLKLAQECNFPSSLVTKGHCPEWTAETHIGNLIRLVGMTD